MHAADGWTSDKRKVLTCWTPDFLISYTPFRRFIPFTMEAETPLVEHLATPFTFDSLKHAEKIPLLSEKAAFPMPSWTSRWSDRHGRRFPQSIAHRGYKAKHPENTMEAFRGAVKAGAHAIETDIHLTKDDVVVLSHDATLKRCFGVDKKIRDCDWDYLSTLRTLKSPHEPMPRLKDLLEYAAAPGTESIWILLDIKLDNNADDVMRLIGRTVHSVRPGRRAWKDRIVLGCWAAKLLPLCFHYLPGFPISHIGFSTSYARRFLDVPNVSFNMLQKILLGPIGNKFIRDAKAADRQLFAWTVNETNMMKWCVQKELDGVITDDPKRFNEVCESWDDNEPEAEPSWVEWAYTFWLYLVVMVFGLMFRWKFPEGVERFARKQSVPNRQAMKQ